jgi:CspA family cold shock protein
VNKGIAKWFNSQTGFRFMQLSSGGNDVFVHVRAVECAGLNTLSGRVNVSFDIVADHRTCAAPE